MELPDQTPSPHPILQTLTDRGWSFSQAQQLHALITIHSALADDHDNVANSLETDLLNTDLRSIGGKSLPDPLSLRKLSHLQGPKVLQVVAVRDIAVSSVEGFNSGSSHRRVLRLVLTDGHVEVTAIEYSRIPAIDIDSVVPGTKVRLENHVPVHSGIVCLGPKTITVIGGVVESLCEEWKMNKKYAGMSRSSLRVSQEADGGGPPPFEKLQIEAPIRRSAQRATHSEYADPVLESSSKDVPKTAANSATRMLHTQSKLEKIEGERAMDSGKHLEKKESNPKASRREVALYVPIQKQANAEKHFQKVSQPDQVDGYSGQKYKAKGKLEDSLVSTLDKDIEYADPMLESSSKDVPKTAPNSDTRMLRTQSKLEKIEGEWAMDSRKHLEKKERNPKASRREVAFYVPVQKRANAEKYLQKMSQPDQVDGYSGQNYKAKGKLEDSLVSTLDKEIDHLESTCQNSVPISMESAETSEIRTFDGQHNGKDTSDAVSANAHEQSIEQKTSTSETRKKEDRSESSCQNSVPISMESAGTSEIRTSDGQHNGKDTSDAVSANSHEQSIEQKTSTSETRKKEVAESVPVQNQAASQKLLHKMSQSDQALRHSRGRRPKGRFKEKYITLDEWERRKLGSKDTTKSGIPDTNLDEDIALQLQHQLDVEDSHAQRGKPNMAADDIRMSMFNYGRESDGHDGTEHGRRGRGRGKGRGRGGGRGRHY